MGPALRERWRTSTVVQCSRSTVKQVIEPGRPITIEMIADLRLIALIGPATIFSSCICMALPPSARIGFRRVPVYVLASLCMGSTIPLHYNSTYSFGAVEILAFRHELHIPPGPLRVALLGIDQDDELSEGRHECRNVSRSVSFRGNSLTSYRSIFYTCGLPGVCHARNHAQDRRKINDFARHCHFRYNPNTSWRLHLPHES